MRRLAVLGFWLCFAACSGNATITEPLDASALVDAASLDASAFVDAAADAATDASSVALPGFGTIAGPCGRVAGEVGSRMPSYFVTRLDFMGDGFDDPAERPLLTTGAQEILSEGTAGGSSGESEAFAFEVLARCEGASLVKTETEIVYEPPSSKKTDILVAIDGENVGVSVVRAVGFPRNDPYTVEDATAILERKLDDILESSANVVSGDAWEKQILVVVAYADMHADSVRAAWDALDETTRADTIVYVIVTDGDDAALY